VGLFQTTGLLEEELFQLCHVGVIEGVEPQISLCIRELAKKDNWTGFGSNPS
jgi:hypothetical protein